VCTHWANFKHSSNTGAYTLGLTLKHICAHTLGPTPKTLVRAHWADCKYICAHTLGPTVKTLVCAHWADYKHIQTKHNTLPHFNLCPNITQNRNM